MRVLSVNVGLPTDVPWRGQTVRTAIWKRPVDGRCRVRRLNLDGDAQGDLQAHGGEHRAVFVYQVESYHYWERELGRGPFPYGYWGENLTIEGLADDEVSIGDRYRIGSALFEVTQPRVTCWRLGIRTDEPRMPALVVSHGRPGFDFRVLEEGDVGAGDTIEKIGAGPEGMSVQEVSSLLYLPRHPLGELRRAVSIPALSEGWRASFQALMEQQASPGGSTGNPGLTSAGRNRRRGRAFASFAFVSATPRAAPWPRSSSSQTRDSGYRALPPVSSSCCACRSRAATGPSFAAIRSRPPRTPTATASASSARRTAWPVQSCTIASAWAIRSRSPLPAARSRFRPALAARSCCSARASESRRCWRCSTPWRARARAARSGGCTGPVAAPSTPSSATPASSSPASPMGIGTCATAGRRPATCSAATTTRPAT